MSYKRIIEEIQDMEYTLENLKESLTEIKSLCDMAEDVKKQKEEIESIKKLNKHLMEENREKNFRIMVLLKSIEKIGVRAEIGKVRAEVEREIKEAESLLFLCLNTN